MHFWAGVPQKFRAYLAAGQDRKQNQEPGQWSCTVISQKQKQLSGSGTSQGNTQIIRQQRSQQHKPGSYTGNQAAAESVEQAGVEARDGDKTGHIQAGTVTGNPISEYTEAQQHRGADDHSATSKQNSCPFKGQRAPESIHRAHAFADSRCRAHECANAHRGLQVAAMPSIGNIACSPSAILLTASLDLVLVQTHI